MWKLMISRIIDISIPENIPWCYGKLINYFWLEIVNDINRLHRCRHLQQTWLVDPGKGD